MRRGRGLFHDWEKAEREWDKNIFYTTTTTPYQRESLLGWSWDSFFGKEKTTGTPNPFALDPIHVNRWSQNSITTLPPTTRYLADPNKRRSKVYWDGPDPFGFFSTTTPPTTEYMKQLERRKEKAQRLEKVLEYGPKKREVASRESRCEESKRKSKPAAMRCPQQHWTQIGVDWLVSGKVHEAMGSPAVGSSITDMAKQIVKENYGAQGIDHLVNLGFLVCVEALRITNGVSKEYYETVHNDRYESAEVWWRNQNCQRVSYDHHGSSGSREANILLNGEQATAKFSVGDVHEICVTYKSKGPSAVTCMQSRSPIMNSTQSIVKVSSVLAGGYREEDSPYNEKEIIQTTSMPELIITTTKDERMWDYATLCHWCELAGMDPPELEAEALDKGEKLVRKLTLAKEEQIFMDEYNKVKAVHDKAVAENKALPKLEPTCYFPWGKDEMTFIDERFDERKMKAAGRLRELKQNFRGDCQRYKGMRQMDVEAARDEAVTKHASRGRKIGDDGGGVFGSNFVTGPSRRLDSSRHRRSCSGTRSSYSFVDSMASSQTTNAWESQHCQLLTIVVLALASFLIASSTLRKLRTFQSLSQGLHESLMHM